MDDARRLIARLAVAVMVADGRVTEPELATLERLEDLGLGPLSALVQEELQRAVRQPIDVEDACAQLSSLSPHAAAVTVMALAEIAASDRVVEPREVQLLTDIGIQLGLGVAETSHILSSVLHARASVGPLEGPSRAAQARVEHPTAAAPGRVRVGPEATRVEEPRELGAGEDPDLTRARAVLGIAAGADPAELDAAYRELVERYSPAKVLDLGPEFVVLAVRRLAAITAAYEAVRDTLAGAPARPSAGI